MSSMTLIDVRDWLKNCAVSCTESSDISNAFLGDMAAVIDAHIAAMAKRLEAAERKVSCLTAMRNEWERDAREHLNTFGQHLPASVECLVERFDAATQEGEG